MSVRIRYSVKVQISSDPSIEDKDLGNLSYELCCDELGEGGVRKFVLAAGAADVSLNLGNISSASFVFIRTTAHDPTLDPSAITVRKNSTGGEAITIQPLPDSAEAHLLLSSTGITALYASNPGAVAMDIILATGGD